MKRAFEGRRRLRRSGRSRNGLAKERAEREGGREGEVELEGVGVGTLGSDTVERRGRVEDRQTDGSHTLLSIENTPPNHHITPMQNCFQ